MDNLAAQDVAYMLHAPMKHHVIEISEGEYAVIGDVLIHRDEGSRRRDAHSDLEFYGSSYAEYRIYCVCIDCDEIGVHVTQNYKINSAQDALIQARLLEGYGYE